MSDLIEHLAIIPDGSGRWAKQRHLPRYFGHYQGYKNFINIIHHCIERRIKIVSVYTLSKYNMGRDAKEVKSLLAIMLNYFINADVKKLHQKNVRLRFIGDLDRIQNKSIVKSLKSATELTQSNTALTLNISVAYSGRWDILQATKKMYEQLSAGHLTLDQINESTLGDYTNLGQMPNPEFCIRTGGEYRISDFCIWQLAYAELFFSDLLWPDFTPEKLDKALEDYATRKRRFGLEAK